MPRAPLQARIEKPDRVFGHVRMPGDKSISHRALIFASLGKTPSTLKNLAPGMDVRHTATCLQTLGANIDWTPFEAHVTPGKWKTPSIALDCGNSGTTMRLLAGLVAGLDKDAQLIGDASLSKRPMARIVHPLIAMGADVHARENDFAPLVFHSRGKPLIGRHHELALASAQVKSCILLAGLFAEGTTSVREPMTSRTHTEAMLHAMGAPIQFSPDGRISIQKAPQPIDFPLVFDIPGDVSSAAFFAAAALIHPEGTIDIENVAMSAERLGFFNIAARMGADVEVTLNGKRLGEPWGTLRARGGRPLKATSVEAWEVPSIIDEIPILGLLMTLADGESRVRGAGELRKKESDRISMWVRNFRAMGINVEEQEDGFSIVGPQKLYGAQVDAFGDHRLAMTMSIAGLAAEGKTTVTGAEWADISFPGFYDFLSRLTDGAVQLKESAPYHV